MNERPPPSAAVVPEAHRRALQSYRLLAAERVAALEKIDQEAADAIAARRTAIRQAAAQADSAAAQADSAAAQADSAAKAVVDRRPRCFKCGAIVLALIETCPSCEQRLRPPIFAPERQEEGSARRRGSSRSSPAGDWTVTLIVLAVIIAVLLQTVRGG